jgi:hypothetical protein
VNALRKPRPIIQSALPKPGLTPVELAHDLLSRIERGNDYARDRKHRFRLRSVAVKAGALVLSATSTIILGLQNLDGWTGVAFALVTVVTVVSALEPFFAWRSLWILMEDTEQRFYHLRDEVSFYVAATPPDQLDPAVLHERFGDYQAIWAQLGSRWLEHRRPDPID